MFCSSVGGADFGGHIALIYKGSTSSGDCDGTTKVFFAQEANAGGVIFWNGFGGFPFGLGPGDHVAEVTVPAVMLSGNDSETLADTVSPDAATSSFNTIATTVTIHADPAPIPGFADSMTDFTSAGPARLTNDLKPDISAPGADITSAGVGTGDGAAVLSGTSMAAPHVSGSAVLLRQIHPSWGPAQIKALMMDQATRAMKNNDLTTPVPATVMGSGRIRVFQSAIARSLAWPGSLSYGLRYQIGDVLTDPRLLGEELRRRDAHVRGVRERPVLGLRPRHDRPLAVAQRHDLLGRRSRSRSRPGSRRRCGCG